MIDLRSDVKTRPTEAMRRAMAQAEVGDDNAREDPTVRALEERSAELLGKPAALFVTSGTQGNLLCLLALSRPGDKILLEATCHLFRWERAGLARIAGLLAHPLPGRHGALDPVDIREACWPLDVVTGPTTLVALENTHNAAGGTCLTTAQTAAVAEVAREHGARVHLDGSRIFNAAVALGVEARELVAPVDTVNFCLSKGLGCPVGSVICGSEAVMAAARDARRMLGGGMRQAGVIAAAGLVALEQELPRLHEDHHKARRLAQTLAELPGVEIDLATVQTNLVRFSLGPGLPNADQVCARLREHGVLAGPAGERALRLVAHRDVSEADTDRACAALRAALG